MGKRLGSTTLVFVQSSRSSLRSIVRHRDDFAYAVGLMLAPAPSPRPSPPKLFAAKIARSGRTFRANSLGERGRRITYLSPKSVVPEPLDQRFLRSSSGGPPVSSLSSAVWTFDSVSR